MRPLPRTIAASSAGFVLVFSLLGCGGREEAQALARAGAQTSTTLADYYSGLATDVLDIWELEAFNAALRGVPFDASQQARLQKLIDALEARARMARKLGAAYQALAALGSYDASGELKTAAGDLADTVKAVPGLPGVSSLPSDLFGSLAGQLASWKQTRDLKRGANLLQTTVERLARLFATEAEAYRSIHEERALKMGVAAEFLLDKNLVAPWALLQKVPESLGLQWIAPDKPVEDAAARTAFVEVARVRSRRQVVHAAVATGGIQDALARLAAAHEDLANGRHPSMEDIRSALERARGAVEALRARLSKPD